MPLCDWWALDQSRRLSGYLTSYSYWSLITQTIWTVIIEEPEGWHTHTVWPGSLGQCCRYAGKNWPSWITPFFIPHLSFIRVPPHNYCSLNQSDPPPLLYQNTWRGFGMHLEFPRYMFYQVVLFSPPDFMIPSEWILLVLPF